MKASLTKFFSAGKRKSILIGAVATFIAVVSLGYFLLHDIGGNTSSSEPPPAILEIDGVQQTSAVGTYCWTGKGMAKCVDKIGIPTPKIAIVASADFSATLRLPINEPPDTLNIWVIPASKVRELQVDGHDLRWWEAGHGADNSLPLRSKQPLDLELEPGLNVISIFAQWQGRGDVVYGFLVDVN